MLDNTWQLFRLNQQGLLIGTRGCPRLVAQQQIFARLGLPIPTVLYYEDFLSNNPHINFSQYTWCKFDSPGSNIELTQHLIKLGRPFTPSQIGIFANNKITDAHKRYSTHAWFLGFQLLLKRIEAQLAAHHIFLLNAVNDILLMSDKLLCQQHLHTHQFKTPLLLGKITSFEHLQELLKKHQLSRVFLKPRFGSSAAGIMAYQQNSRGQSKLSSTIEISNSNASIENFQLFNSLKIQQYTSLTDQAKLIDFCAQDELYAESWVPKPSLDSKQQFDIRFLSLFKKPCHRVIRASSHPFTNLHLGNARYQTNDIFTAEQTNSMENTIQKLSLAFPNSHIFGVDAIFPQLNKYYIFEVNCFGDYLHQTTWQEVDPYTYQAKHLYGL